MNIFVLDFNIKKSAEYLVDKHVVKMPLETAQLLSGVIYVDRIGFIPRALNKEEREALRSIDIPEAYKPTHINHPCAIWARSSFDNFIWLLDYLSAIGQEFRFRYGKDHLSVLKMEDLPHPNNLPFLGLTTFPLAMPDEYKTSCPVESYRAYYKGAKGHLATWKNREKPMWY